MTISLQTITLCNFKSYKGEVVMGPFHSFMTIVGPNGSGKSNIVDAIRFVLGDVLNTLRVKRFNELVYGASFGKPTNESTYVTATFLIDDNEEKSFTRVIQGGSSQYKINNKIVKSDIYMTALREYGLDIKAENFLVTQGYVECIAMKTPKELNAMFEQISGSYVYKENYRRLKVKLAQVEDEVQFAQHVKRQLIINKKCTVIEKEKAEKYLKLQEQYVRQAKEEKLQYQLIRLFLIKKTVESLQNEDKDIKSRQEVHLHDKNNMMLLLERKKQQFKPLTNSLENVEQSILKLEDVIQEKKAEYAVLKESISYWQNKRDCARISLESANLARDANSKTIQELQDELRQITNKLAEFKKVSKQSAIELSDSQVKRYHELKNIVESRAKDLVKRINGLNHDQQADRDRLDNENRRKQELEDKMKQIALMKEDLKTRLRKLQSSVAESKAALTENTAKKQQLNVKITETNEKSLSLKDNIRKVLEELQEADIDNYTISQQKKKAETIVALKQFFPGVHDRLSNLCRPIHSRYKIAIIKVFGKNMDAIVVDTMNTAVKCINFLKLHRIGAERFLPLNSLEPETLKERLRDIGEPNVKLLYDVLYVSSPKIYKAILFATKNTLVCETPEDARRVAYEIDRRGYDCVSVDGCFYRRDGMISGGKADLMSKAKQWEERDIVTLNEQRDQLKKELYYLPNVSLLQSELDVVDMQFKGLSLRNKIIEKDLKDTEDKITKIYEESTEYDTQLSLLNETISKIQRDVQARDEELEDVKRHISTIEKSVFANFCRDINVPDIDYYEKNHLWTCQERKRKQMELEKQHDLIRNQLRFEKDRDMEDKISNWTLIMEQADVKLSEMHQQERSTKNAIEREEQKLSKVQEECVIVKENLADLKNSITQCRSQIDVISESYLQAQKAHIVVQNNIGRQKAKCESIFKECKMEDIIIPIVPERSRKSSDPSSSSSITDSSADWDVSSKIDFSQFPKDVRDGTEENLQNIAKQRNEKLTEIQNELETIVDPNLKALENMDAVMQQIQEISQKLKELREKSNGIRKQFEMVKKKRYDLFSECVERITAEIDSIYKSLVNNHTSACAFILMDNPEEPYEGGINYSCIAPSKRFQPLQNLSGGEKTLASLALLFAFQRYKPAPFFVMDESDAALDNVNIKNLVCFIQSQANTTQFIIVSLQKSLYFCSDALLGVTIEPDAECTQSKALAILLKEYKEKPDDIDVN